MEYHRIILLLPLIACINCIPLAKREEVAPCSNVYNECPEWKNAGFCEQNRDYMQSTCPLTCGFCKEPEAEKQAYSSQNQQYPDSSSYPQTPQAGQPSAAIQSNAAPQTNQAYTNQQSQPSTNVSASPAQTNASRPLQKPDKENEASDASQEKVAPSKKKEKSVKDLKNESNTDESDSQSDEEPATNEQTHPSSKHIEKENVVEDQNSNEKDHVKESDFIESFKESSGLSGSGLAFGSDGNVEVNGDLEDGSKSNDFLIEDKTGKLIEAKESFDTVKRFNNNMHFSSVPTEDVQEEEEETSGNVIEEESGSGIEESSGVKKMKTEEDDENPGENTKSEENDKDKNKNEAGKAAEEERTENAEKYEDEEKQNQNGVKPVQQRSHEKKNLMQTMLDNGDLRAVSVSKAKTRQKVPVHHHKEAEEDGGDEDEEDVTDVDLDFKETGLEHFSGSGGEDDKMHVTLRQNFDKKYEDQNAPAYKILSGNFEKDLSEALGDDTAVTDVSFSEAEVEGNPRTTGKVRANFKFNGDYKKLQKLISSGNINGLLVIKNSLEGPMLNLEEAE